METKSRISTICLQRWKMSLGLMLSQTLMRKRVPILLKKSTYSIKLPCRICSWRSRQRHLLLTVSRLTSTWILRSAKLLSLKLTSRKLKSLPPWIRAILITLREQKKSSLALSRPNTKQWRVWMFKTKKFQRRWRQIWFAGDQSNNPDRQCCSDKTLYSI